MGQTALRTCNDESDSMYSVIYKPYSNTDTHTHTQTHTHIQFICIFIYNINIYIYFNTHIIYIYIDAICIKFLDYIF